MFERATSESPPGPRGSEIPTEGLYWKMYLWHHRDPRTRRLHHIGSWVCLAGLGLTLAGAGWAWVPASIAVGYGFAFAGHYLVERNRPLTLKHPVRAAICNWVMFFYEMVHDIDGDLKAMELFPPDTSEMDSY